MKIYSVNLETQIELDDAELDDLKTKALTGRMNFRGNTFQEEFERIIPTELRYYAHQREFVEVELIPSKVYFGDAEKVVFVINNEFYKNVKERGKYSARFFTSGKLDIRNRKRRKC